MSAWDKTQAELEADPCFTTSEPKTVLKICADNDHLPYGKNNYRVSISDLDIFMDNWSLDNLPSPNCP
jgi:hypothetical protein